MERAVGYALGLLEVVLLGPVVGEGDGTGDSVGKRDGDRVVVG